MDFPVNLTNSKLVSSMDEFKQTIEVLLRTPYGNFMQNPNMGSLVDIHVADSDIIDENVRATLEQINGVKVDTVLVKGERVDVVLKYNGEIKKFTFNISLL